MFRALLHHPRWALVFLLLTSLALLLPGTASLPLVDRDEPRFATATREMREAGEWVVPTFNGAERFDKPVLTYWLMRAFYSLAGVTELGARLHTVVTSLLLVLAVFLAARRWYGDAAGFWAGLSAATTLQVFIHGRLAVADMPMVLALFVAQGCLFELLQTSRPRTAAWWGLYGALGLGFLAKGPLVLAVPLLTLLLHRFVFWRQPLPWARLRPVAGLAVVLVLVASWGVPALLKTEGRFWSVGVGHHVVERGMEGFNARTYSPFFYLGTAPLSLFPWILVAGAAFARLRPRREAGDSWLLSWFLAPYLIFTCYATQLPHYVLPGFPAFFLILGRLLGSEEGLPRTFWVRGARVAWWFFAGLLLFLTVFIAGGALPEGAEPVRGALYGTVAVLAGLLLVAATAFYGKPGRLGLLLVGLLAAGYGAHAMGRGLREVSLTLRLFAHRPVQETQGGLSAGLGYGEPSLVFYDTLRSRWVFPADAATLAKLPQAPRRILVFESQVDLLRTLQAPWRARFGLPPQAGPRREEVALEPAKIWGGSWTRRRVEGFNLGRTRWQSLVVFEPAEHK